MRTTMILVGKTTDKALDGLIGEYIDRLRHYLSFDVTVIPELRNTRSLSREQQKEKEADLILRELSPADTVVLLDEKGQEMTSQEFARDMQSRMNTVRSRLVFIIGGPWGFSDRVYERADGRMSLSRMTFSHQMVRLIFAEQLYRAMSILSGSPYHHE